MNNHLSFFITTNTILILSNRDFRKIGIAFLCSDAIIEESKNAVLAAEKLSDGDRVTLRTPYSQILQYLEMVCNSFVGRKYGGNSLALLASFVWRYANVTAIIKQLTTYLSP